MSDSSPRSLSPEHTEELDRLLVAWAALEAKRRYTFTGSQLPAQLDAARDAIHAFVESLLERERSDQERLDAVYDERWTVESRQRDFAVWADDRDGEGSSCLGYGSTPWEAIDAAIAASRTPSPVQPEQEKK